MSLTQWLILLACAPALVWLAAIAVTAGRRAFRRRGSEDQQRRRLMRLFSRREVVVIPTGDIPLSEQQVLDVASRCGYRLLGYERGNGPLRRRSGVFLRNGGAIDALGQPRPASAG